MGRTNGYHPRRVIAIYDRGTDRSAVKGLVGGPGFEPGASRSRTALALGPGYGTGMRLSSLRLELEFATCRCVTL